MVHSGLYHCHFDSEAGNCLTFAPRAARRVDLEEKSDVSLEILEVLHGQAWSSGQARLTSKIDLENLSDLEKTGLYSIPSLTPKGVTRCSGCFYQ